jgi:hypothetical protein
LCTAITPHSSLNLSLRYKPLEFFSPGKAMLLLSRAARRGDRPRRSSLKRILSLRSKPLKVCLLAECLQRLLLAARRVVGLAARIYPPSTNY